MQRKIADQLRLMAHTLIKIALILDGGDDDGDGPNSPSARRRRHLRLVKIAKVAARLKSPKEIDGLGVAHSHDLSDEQKLR